MGMSYNIHYCCKKRFEETKSGHQSNKSKFVNLVHIYEVLEQHI